MSKKRLLTLGSSVFVLLVLTALPFMGACAPEATPAPPSTPSPASSPSPKPVPTFELKLHTCGGPQNPRVIMQQYVCSEVEKLTEGRVKIKAYVDSLGTSFESLDIVQKGIADFSEYAFGFCSMKNLPFLLVGSLPFVYKDQAAWYGAWTKEDTLPSLCQDYIVEEGYDQLVMLPSATFVRGQTDMVFTKKEVRVPDDLKGLKVRAVGLGLTLIDEYYEGTTVSMGSGEIYEALERGLIDGTIGLETNWIDWGWGEVAPYHLDLDMDVVGFFMIANKSTLDKLSPTDQVIVMDSFRWLSREVALLGFTDTLSYERKMLDIGMKTYRPTPEEMEIWAAPADGLISSWLDVVGERGEVALEVIKKYNE